MTGQDSLVGFMTGANNVSDGMFGILTLVTAFIIMVFAWRGYDTKSSIAAASFITALLSIFLRLIQWIPDQVMFGCFILAGVSFVLLRWG
jgi:energy-converting hydrogenase Eha subunit G